MRIHIGCGPVYLDGYVNCDLEIEGHHLAEDRPDLVELNITTVDNYYTKNITKQEFLAGKFHKEGVVVDKFASAFDLDTIEGSIDEILAMQLFEHFTFAEGRELLDYWLKLLKPGGSVRLHVPDMQGIFDEYQEQGDINWTLRQIYGSQKNGFGLHHSGYTRETLASLMEDIGFVNIEQLPNINSYAAFGIRGYKA